MDLVKFSIVLFVGVVVLISGNSCQTDARKIRDLPPRPIPDGYHFMTTTLPAIMPDNKKDASALLQKLGATLVCDLSSSDPDPGELSIGGNPAVNDDVISLLRFFPNIRDLVIVCAPVTDKSMPFVKSLIGLKRLALTRTQVGNQGITNIETLPYLEDLRLGGTNVTDDGIQSLCKIRTLRILDLVECNITDVGLERLTLLPDLVLLGLNDTKVTDTGVMKVVTMKTLKEIDLNHTRVSLECVHELRRLRPDMRVAGLD